MRHHEIAQRFNTAFGRTLRTVLVGGAAEPLYLPVAAGRPAIIRYTRDYAQSALHEVAHWCLAGSRRRALVDYGYWYEPPPRSASAQARFEAVETPVQGLEYLLALVAGVRFHVSADNLGVSNEGLSRLELRIQASARQRLAAPFPLRTAAVFDALNRDWRRVLGALAVAMPDAEPAKAAATAVRSCVDTRNAHALR